MLEYTISDGKKIYVFEKLLSEDICDQWIQEVEKVELVTSICKNQSLADRIFKTIQEKIGVYPISANRAGPEVTIAKRGVPIQAHYDPVINGEKYKVLCFLNEVEYGGTEFQDGDSWILVKPGRGHVIIFDIGLYHRGDLRQEIKAKYTIGIRLLE